MTTLEKMRAEIEQNAYPIVHGVNNHEKGMTLYGILQIFDKYAEQGPCDDAISREMALKECHDIVVEGERYRVIQEETLLALPPVRPQEQTGHWNLLDECANSGYYCSECQKKLVKEGWSKTVKKIKFCPNCGAKMIESQENEE